VWPVELWRALVTLSASYLSYPWIFGVLCIWLNEKKLGFVFSFPKLHGRPTLFSPKPLAVIFFPCSPERRSGQPSDPAEQPGRAAQPDRTSSPRRPAAGCPDAQAPSRTQPRRPGRRSRPAEASQHQSARPSRRSRRIAPLAARAQRLAIASRARVRIAARAPVVRVSRPRAPPRLRPCRPRAVPARPRLARHPRPSACPCAQPAPSVRPFAAHQRPSAPSSSPAVLPARPRVSRIA